MLVLARNSALDSLGEVTVAPITTTIRDIPTEVVLGPADGMPRDFAINLDHLQTVARSSIGPRLTMLDAGRIREIKEALLFALGLDDAMG